MAPTRRPTPFAPPTYRFDECVLHTRPTRLLVRGELVALQPQPARALELLLQNAGHVVSREQLKTHIWGAETYLDHDQGINFAIRKIRMALDDDAAAPRFVETVPRVGYRFLSAVTRVASDPVSPRLDVEPGEAGEADEPGERTQNRNRDADDEPEAETTSSLSASHKPSNEPPHEAAHAAQRPAQRADAEIGEATLSPGTRPADGPSADGNRTGAFGTAEALAASAPASATATAASRRPSRLVAALGALVTALVVTWALARPGDPQGAMPPATEAVLAVAPFDLAGVDDGAAPLAVAIHELLTRRLAMRLDAAPTVLASTSLRRGGDSVAALGADYVLRGRLAHHGERVHLTLRLEPASGQQHLWAGTFEPRLAELPAWYDEVARHVAAALQVEATTVAPALAEPLPADDATALLSAYGHLVHGDAAHARHALAEIERLAARLPDSAFAQAARAEAQWRLRGDDPRAALEVVEIAARHALELNAELASAHLALSHVARLLHHDWDTAEREAERAVELAPGWHSPLLARAALATSRGRHDAARRDIEAARRLDPVGAETLALGIAVAYYAGRWDEAVDAARDTLLLDPYHRSAHDLLTRALLAAGRRDEALHHLGLLVAMSGQPAPASLGEALARQRESWSAAAAAGHPVAAEQALWAALSGDLAGAHELLELACREQPTEALGFAAVEPAFVPLRRRRDWRGLSGCLPPLDVPKTAR